MSSPVTVNGRTYVWPDRPLVVVCIDGNAPAYFDRAVAAGAMPYLAGARARGADLISDCVIPSFTNPNNLSIVTGVPPAVHGICGNYFLDPDTGTEVMMNDARFLRAETIFAAFHKKGAKIAVVTAKDKLRGLLGHGLSFGNGTTVCFSSEKADRTSEAENGIARADAFVGLPIPEVYSAELSRFIFEAGVKIMDARRPDVMYLSTTDYIQHKHAPGTTAANAFYAMMDGYFARLDALGATLALTADHGMNAKHRALDQQPDVIYLQDLLDGWLGAGRARVILPITDPYVVHHGALGSFAVLHLPAGTEADVIARVAALDGIESALPKAEACRRFELPPDRMGDVIVVSTIHKVLGTSAARHDLSALKEPLRSHGGVSEQEIPMVLNRPVRGLDPRRRLRNFDVFDVALNHVQ